MVYCAPLRRNREALSKRPDKNSRECDIWNREGNLRGIHTIMKITEEQLIKIIQEEIALASLEEKKKSGHPPQYDAPEGSKRDKQLDQTKADLESGDPERVKRAYDRREKMEKKEREKSSWENKPRSDSESANESVEETEFFSLLESLVAEVLEEELSKKTKATLRKKAKKRGLTPGSVEAEYKKGLAAWASSGSRKGMSQHQWAMARVNSANPSKSWAVVKKSKAKKK